MIDLEVEVRRPRFELRASFRSTAQVTGLFGPSGAGKSTLLYAIAGVLRPTAGRISILGRTFWDGGTSVFLPPDRRRVGMVFQDNHLFPHLDVRGNLLFGLRRTPVAERRLDLEEIADLLGLVPLLDKRVDALSGGEARRVAIGRALLTSPSLLILDEPLTGLDRRLRDRILAYLIRLKRKLGVRMIYVSHSYSDLAALADEMVLAETVERDGLRTSRMEKIAPPVELLTEAEGIAGAGPLETVFRGVVTEVSREAGFAIVRAEEGMMLRVPLEGQEIGARAVVTMRADEVLLATGEAPRISARNVWTGTVTRIQRFPTRTVVEVNAGRTILAEVTEGAVRDLALAVGKSVHVLAKTRSLRVTALPTGMHIGPDGED